MEWREGRKNGKEWKIIWENGKEGRKKERKIRKERLDNKNVLSLFTILPLHHPHGCILYANLTRDVPCDCDTVETSW